MSLQFESENKLRQEALSKAEASVQELKGKCTQLERKVNEQEKGLAREKEENNSCNKEIACYKELIK